MFGRKKNKKKNNNMTNTSNNTAATSFGGRYNNDAVNIMQREQSSNFGGYGSSFGYGNSQNRNSYSNGIGNYGRYMGQSQPNRNNVQENNVKPKQQPKNEKKKKTHIFEKKRSVNVSTSRNKSAGVICTIVFFTIFVYIVGYTINVLSRKDVKYDTISYGTIETPSTVQGVIIRDEKVYKTSADGVIEYDAADGDKVKTGSVVCSIMNADEVAEMEKSLSEINDNIMKIQNERGDISIYSDDVKRANRQIKAVVDDDAEEFTKLNINKVYEMRNNIENKLDERNQLLLSESQGDLTELVSQRKAQQSKLDNSISKIAVDEGGIVSYYIDGKEEEYSPAGMLQLTKKQTLVSSNVQGDYKHSVKAGDTVFKIVRSNDWYIAAYVNVDSIADWKQGENRKIYVKNATGATQELEAVVNSIAAGSNDNEKYITLKITKDMLDFMSARSVTFETQASKRGFKVPNSAIASETTVKVPSDYITDENKVIKVETNAQSGKTTETTVDVVVSGEDKENNISYVAVEMSVINVGMVLKKPGGSETFTIKETDTRQGVYVVNSGITEFKIINMDGAISNSTHTILDDNKNKNIFVYDRIMTNTEDVQKEQKVYE